MTEFWLHSFNSILFQILKFQFWLVKNSTKFEGKILFLNICQKCVIWRQKTCCWCQRNLKFCTDANYVVLKKTPQNNFFLWAEQHGQNGIWNLEIFVEFFHRQKIFGVLIWGLCSTCPHNFIYPACRMLELQLIYWQFLLLQ